MGAETEHAHVSDPANLKYSPGTPGTQEALRQPPAAELLSPFQTSTYFLKAKLSQVYRWSADDQSALDAVVF